MSTLAYINSYDMGVGYASILIISMASRLVALPFLAIYCGHAGGCICIDKPEYKNLN